MISPTGKAFTVTGITSEIKKCLEGTIGRVEVTGEISNLRPPSASGHLYFTLKDATAQLNAVIYANTLRTISPAPVNGQKVNVTGEISVYAQRGSYQITVRKLTQVGAGDLMAQFEAMKAKLNAEGLFDQAKKKPLPFLPRHIGIVTAPTGAAIRDMINVLTRRFPNLDILIAPARVQGAGAAEEIAQGIRDLNEVGDPLSRILPQYPKREVIIVARGGGSLEDLWSFNEEVVARAVYASDLPVISGVGHEIDFTICDFTADYRAPTPSAAAEIVVKPKKDLADRVGVLAGKVDGILDRKVTEMRGRLDAMKSHRVFSEPAHIVENYAQHVDYLAARSDTALDSSLAEGKRRLSDLSARLDLQRAQCLPELRNRIADLSARLDIQRAKCLPELRNRLVRLSEQASRAIEVTVEKRRRTLDLAAGKLTALSPVKVLERGYSITLLDDGRALRTPEEAPAGTRLTTKLSGGKSVVSVVGGRARPAVRKTEKMNSGQEQLDLFA